MHLHERDRDACLLSTTAAVVVIGRRDRCGAKPRLNFLMERADPHVLRRKARAWGPRTERVTLERPGSPTGVFAFPVGPVPRPCR